MADAKSNAVPRTPDEPTPETVLDVMSPCEPYTARDLTDVVDYDVSRWTIQRRLEALHEGGQIRKKKHSDNRVTWWVED